MAELIAKGPCEGLLPVEHGGVRLVEVEMQPLTMCMPFAGQAKAFSTALKSAHGMAAPGVGRMTGKEGARAIWFGRNAILLAGPEPDPELAKIAAITDQSDAWAVVRLEGDASDQVLARLVPIDLRPAHFKRGYAARTQLGHMNASIVRISDKSIQIMVFRSMAATLIHEIETAMRGVAARKQA